MLESWVNAPPELSTYRVVLLGGGGAGKSSLITRIIHNEFEEEIFDPTLAEEYPLILSYKKKTIEIIFIDTAGQDQYYELRKECIQKSDGLLLVYDVTSRMSFEEVIALYEQCLGLKESTPEDPIPMILVGNKSDLPQREISFNEGYALAKQLGCPFFEISNKIQGEDPKNLLFPLIDQLEVRSKKKKKMGQSSKTLLKKQLKEIDTKEKKEQREKNRQERRSKDQEKLQKFEAWIQRANSRPSTPFTPLTTSQPSSPSPHSSIEDHTRYMDPKRQSDDTLVQDFSNVVNRPRRSRDNSPAPPRPVLNPNRSWIKCFNHTQGREDDCVKIPLSVLTSIEDLKKEVSEAFDLESHETPSVGSGGGLKGGEFYLSYDDGTSKVRISKRTTLEELLDEAHSLHLFKT